MSACMFVDTCVQVYVCRYVHAEVARLKLGVFLNYSSFYLQRQGLLLNLELACSAAPSSQLAPSLPNSTGVCTVQACRPAWYCVGAGTYCIS